MKQKTASKPPGFEAVFIILKQKNKPPDYEWFLFLKYVGNECWLHLVY